MQFDAQTVSLVATAEDCHVDEKPQTLGEKPSLFLCPCSPHKYRRHPYGCSVCFAGLVIAQ